MISLLCWNARGQSQMTSVPVETRSTLLSIDRSMSPKAGFRLMDPMKTGVVFTNLLATERHMTNQMLLNGSGVCAGDVDRDGLVDLYFTSLDGPNRLYRNRGQWRFEDITLAAGLDCSESDSTACAFADLDGDADQQASSEKHGEIRVFNEFQGIDTNDIFEPGLLALVFDGRRWQREVVDPQNDRSPGGHQERYCGGFDIVHEFAEGQVDR